MSQNSNSIACSIQQKCKLAMINQFQWTHRCKSLILSYAVLWSCKRLFFFSRNILATSTEYKSKHKPHITQKRIYQLLLNQFILSFLSNEITYQIVVTEYNMGSLLMAICFFSFRFVYLYCVQHNIR